MNRPAHLLLLAALTAALPASARTGPRIGSDKKIVHYFQYWPDSRYLRENVRDVERMPFDGIAIWPTAEIDGTREKRRFNYSYAQSEEEKLLERGPIERVHTWEQAAEAARKRGREIMRAMCREYPDITPRPNRGSAKFGGENVVVVPIVADGSPAGIYKTPVKLAVLR